MKIINASLLSSMFTFAVVTFVHASHEDDFIANDNENTKDKNMQDELACSGIDPRGCGN